MQLDQMATPCTVYRLGLVEYQEAWAEQRRLVDACREDGQGQYGANDDLLHGDAPLCRSLGAA